jgi:hypothetical protein
MHAVTCKQAASPLYALRLRFSVKGRVKHASPTLCQPAHRPMCLVLGPMCWPHRFELLAGSFSPAPPDVDEGYTEAGVSPAGDAASGPAPATVVPDFWLRAMLAVVRCLSQHAHTASEAD